MHCLLACLFKYITVSAFCIYLSVVKMPLKGEVGGHALKSHGNYIVDRVFLNFLGNPVYCACSKFSYNNFQRVNNKGADETAQAGLHL